MANKLEQMSKEDLISFGHQMNVDLLHYGQNMEKLQNKLEMVQVVNDELKSWIKELISDNITEERKNWIKEQIQ